MEICEENVYRLFYQSLEKVKQQLNPAAQQLICEQLTEGREEGMNQERLSLIIHEQFGDCNIVMLVLILALLTMSNHETFITYQQVFNEGNRNVATHTRSKREEELEEQLVDIQKKVVKLQKENEQFRLANERWAQDYDLLRNASGTGGEREKELEEKVKAEKNNFELLRGKYNLLEQTMKEEREELVALRSAQQLRSSSEDMTSTVAEIQLALERHCKELEEVKKTKERYRLERNRYYHELDKQRRNYEAEKKRQQENINTLESQCDRMRVAFAQISDIVYPPKTTTKTRSNHSAQKPPGHVARGPKHSSDVERDKQLSGSRRDEQVTGVTRLNGHDLLNGHDMMESFTQSDHVIPCTGCSKEIPLDKFLEHMEHCTVSTR